MAIFVQNMFGSSGALLALHNSSVARVVTEEKKDLCSKLYLL